jgi:hypothetical protein
VADQFGPYKALPELQQCPGAHTIFDFGDDYIILFVID